MKLAFVNSHPAINYPESLPPNVIEVGGMHIKDPKPLPSNIQDFMSKGEKGAVFIAFGTSLNSETLRGRINNAIFEVIRDLPQYNFILKFDLKDHNYTVPENVLIQPFFSQRDVLNHPNLKAFVTHSGGLSTQEATWFGVPTVGFAVFVDQFRVGILLLSTKCYFGISIRYFGSSIVHYAVLNYNLIPILNIFRSIHYSTFALLGHKRM